MQNHDCTPILLLYSFLTYDTAQEAFTRGIIHPSYFKAQAVANLVRAKLTDEKLKEILRKLAHCELSGEAYDLGFFVGFAGIEEIAHDRRVLSM